MPTIRLPLRLQTYATAGRTQAPPLGLSLPLPGGQPARLGRGGEPKLLGPEGLGKGFVPISFPSFFSLFTYDRRSVGRQLFTTPLALGQGASTAPRGPTFFQTFPFSKLVRFLWKTLWLRVYPGKTDLFSKRLVSLEKIRPGPRPAQTRNPTGPGRAQRLGVTA